MTKNLLKILALTPFVLSPFSSKAQDKNYFSYTENKDFDGAQFYNLEDSAKTTFVAMYDKDKDGKRETYATFPVISFGLMGFEIYDSATLLERDENGDGKIDCFLKDLDKDGFFDIKESYFLFLKFEERLGNLVQTFN